MQKTNTQNSRETIPLTLTPLFSFSPQSLMDFFLNKTNVFFFPPVGTYRILYRIVFVFFDSYLSFIILYQ